jgi:hypothetical protein
MNTPILRAFIILNSAFVIQASAAPINYEKEILPFLKDNCIACHNKTTTKAGLNMETPDLMIKGGENGKGIEAGAGAKSLIWQAAAGEWDSEMPPKGNKVGAVPLDDAELALLKQWIDEGAHHAGRQERVISWEPLPAGFAPSRIRTSVKMTTADGSPSVGSVSLTRQRGVAPAEAGTQS